jgi:dynein heavy chain
MTTLLDQFESHIYSEWRRNVDETCEFNLNQPLVKFSPINGLLSVNFDPKVRLCLSKCIKDAAPVPETFPDDGGTYFNYLNSILGKMAALAVV